MGLTDRKKLRPLIAARASGGNTFYLSSEECAIRILGDEIEEVWAPLAGNPIIIEKENGLVWKGEKHPLEYREIVLTM